MTFVLDALQPPRYGTASVVCISGWLTTLRQSGSFSIALLLDAQRPRTCNNLALLELGRLNADEAERWVMKGLACRPLQLDDEELLQATACELRLFQPGPTSRALGHRAATDRRESRCH